MKKKTFAGSILLLFAIMVFTAIPVAAAKKPKMASSITVSQFEKALNNVSRRAIKEKWNYGNSRSTVPCADKFTSSDRLIARALYDLGFKDQPKGGITIGNMPSYLKKHGFKVSSSVNAIREGSIILVCRQSRTKTLRHYNHCFVVKSMNKKTWATTRWDFGSLKKIRSKQPIKENSWNYAKNTIYVINIPQK